MQNSSPYKGSNPTTPYNKENKTPYKNFSSPYKGRNINANITNNPVPKKLFAEKIQKPNDKIETKDFFQFEISDDFEGGLGNFLKKNSKELKVTDNSPSKNQFGTLKTKRISDDTNYVQNKKTKKDWENKTAQIYDLSFEPEISNKVISINGEEYPIKFINSGEFHNVYVFLTDKPLSIDGQDIPVADVVIRTLKPTLGPLEVGRVYREDIESFDWLQKWEVPIPTIYVRPDLFADTKIKNNCFWIVQKCETQVKKTDEDAFTFAKKWITKSIELNTEIIPDFKADNVMKDKNGNILVVDSKDPAEEEDFEFNIITAILSWSDRNEDKIKLLLADLPEKLKQKFTEEAIHSLSH